MKKKNENLDDLIKQKLIEMNLPIRFTQNLDANDLKGIDGFFDKKKSIIVKM